MPELSANGSEPNAAVADARNLRIDVADRRCNDANMNQSGTVYRWKTGQIKPIIY